MSNKPDYERGDLVRLRVTPGICGQVVGEADWGRSFCVRLRGSIETEWFEADELEFYPIKEAKSDALDAPKGDVINFTKARALRATTKTRGAA